jgi:hypothetical protein
MQAILQSLHPSVHLEEIRTYANVFIFTFLSRVRSLVSVNMNCHSTFGTGSGLLIEVEDSKKDRQGKNLFSYLSLGQLSEEQGLRPIQKKIKI